MTVAQKLKLIRDTKLTLKLALESKGLSPTDEFSTYPGLFDYLHYGGVEKPVFEDLPPGGKIIPSITTLTSSPFSTYGGNFSASHKESRWEIARDKDFSNIEADSGWTSSELTSYKVEASLSPGGVYARVTYRTTSGVESVGDPTYLEALDVGQDILVGEREGYAYLAAPASKRVLREWGSYKEDTALPNDPNPDPNSGTYNTDVLVGRGAGKHPAAEYCRSLGAQYDLPNREELGFLEANKAAIDAADNSGGANTLAAIGAGNGVGSSTPNAWSSTEHWQYAARHVSFSDGNHGKTSRHRERCWVVPVRIIPV